MWFVTFICKNVFVCVYAVQYSAVQFSAMQCRAMQCSAVCETSADFIFCVYTVCGLPDGSKARSRRYASESTKEHEGCVKLMEKVYKQETIAPDPPHIVGEWVSRRSVKYIVCFLLIKKKLKSLSGPVRDLNPGPLAPKARIIPLDQRA